MKKKIGRLIIICLIIIIILTMIIIIKMNEKESEEEIVEEITEFDEDAPYSSCFTSISDGNHYFVIKNILNKYYGYIKDINGDTYIDAGSVTDIETITQEFEENGIEAIQEMLDDIYIDSFNITDEEIRTIADEYMCNGDYSTNTTYNLIINKLYATEISLTSNLFLIDYSINDISSSMLIKIDNENNTFSIYLSDFIEENDYSKDMNEEDINISDSNIEENSYNTFNSNSTSDQDLAREYFRIITTLLQIDSAKIYDLLDEEYKDIRFEEYEDLKQYIENMSEQIDSASLDGYDVETEDDYYIYSLLSDNNMVYVVTANQEDILDFSVQLDDYTVPTDEFIEEYTEASYELKVQTNLDIFFKMLNAKDYDAAYDVLNDSFKERYFATIDEFRKYAENNFFDSTTITIVNELVENTTYYECQVTTANTSDTSEVSEETFFISLGEGTDFELSFTVKE